MKVIKKNLLLKRAACLGDLYNCIPDSFSIPEKAQNVTYRFHKFRQTYVCFSLKNCFQLDDQQKNACVELLVQSIDDNEKENSAIRKPYAQTLHERIITLLQKTKAKTEDELITSVAKKILKDPYLFKLEKNTILRQSKIKEMLRDFLAIAEPADTLTSREKNHLGELMFKVGMLDPDIRSFINDLEKNKMALGRGGMTANQEIVGLIKNIRAMLTEFPLGKVADSVGLRDALTNCKILPEDTTAIEDLDSVEVMFEAAKMVSFPKDRFAKMLEEKFFDNRTPEDISGQKLSVHLQHIPFDIALEQHHHYLVSTAIKGDKDRQLQIQLSKYLLTKHKYSKDAPILKGKDGPLIRSKQFDNFKTIENAFSGLWKASFASFHPKKFKQDLRALQKDESPAFKRMQAGLEFGRGMAIPVDTFSRVALKGLENGAGEKDKTASKLAKELLRGTYSQSLKTPKEFDFQTNVKKIALDCFGLANDYETEAEAENKDALWKTVHTEKAAVCRLIADNLISTLPESMQEQIEKEKSQVATPASSTHFYPESQPACAYDITRFEKDWESCIGSQTHTHDLSHLRDEFEQLEALMTDIEVDRLNTVFESHPGTVSIFLKETLKEMVSVQIRNEDTINMGADDFFRSEVEPKFNRIKCNFVAALKKVPGH